MPSPGQLALLVVAIGFFVAGGAVSLFRLRHEDSERLRLGAKACMYLGLLATAVLLLWHSVHEHRWLPLNDNFEALLWLALLLTLFVLYVQRRRPLGGLDWFVMPVVVLLLIAAGIFGRAKPHDYVLTTWAWTHYVTAFAGFVAFAIAAAAGVMYLITRRRLRHKTALPGPNLGSLERLERTTYRAATVGFALVTIATLTGLGRALRAAGGTMGPHWLHSPKVLLTFCVWVVYAAILHAPINPSFRGRRSALLSILGFALMVLTLVAVQYMPSVK